MNVVGVDPGLTGGIVVVSDGDIKAMYVMPVIEIKKKKRRAIKKGDDDPENRKTESYIANVKELDFAKLHRIFKEIAELNISKVFIEKVSTRPGEGVASSFTFGICFGAIIATVACSKLRYELVTPNVWTRKMLDGISKNITNKDRSKVAASRCFDIDDFVLTGCRKPHSGLVDSALIALYGYNKEIDSV